MTTSAGTRYRFTDHSNARGQWCRFSHVEVTEKLATSDDRRCGHGCPGSDIEPFEPHGEPPGAPPAKECPASGEADAAPVDNGPHMRVTWRNAINGYSVSRCYADNAMAERDAGDRNLEPFNNTDVRLSWHAGHIGAAERDTRRKAHAGVVHVWGVPCRECDAISAAEAAAQAEVDLAASRAQEAAR